MTNPARKLFLQITFHHKGLTLRLVREIRAPSNRAPAVGNKYCKLHLLFYRLINDDDDDAVAVGVAKGSKGNSEDVRY